MKHTLRALSIVALAGAFQLSVAAVPDGYYDSLEGKSGIALKNAVKELIAPHEVISYGDPDPNNSFHPVYVATWSVFLESDTRTVDDVLCWWDMYSANNIWVSDGHPGLNIEHSVANSWWGGKDGSREAYNDLHHLNPSNGDANGAKSNYPLGIVQGTPAFNNGVTVTGSPRQGLGGGASRVFEPYQSYKGDFARAYFYIFTIYDDIPWKTDYAWMYDLTSGLLLRPWAYEMLLEWSAGDAVSVKETERNETVYAYQKNRNPFIDCPQLAEHIWGDKQNEPFHYSLYTPEPSDPDIYPGWDEVFPDMMTGHWAPVTSNDDLNEDEEYFIVSPTKNRAMTYTPVATSTANALDECIYSPRLDESLSPAWLTAVPENIATIRLEKDGDFWHVGVYDPDLDFKGYINVTSKNTAKLSTTKSDSNKVSINVDAAANKTLIAFQYTDSPNSVYTLQYNSGNPRFAAYASNQNPIQLYRATDEVSGIGATGSDELQSEIITGIYDINGRRMNASSVDGLDSGIYIIVTNLGSRKVRK